MNKLQQAANSGSLTSNRNAEVNQLLDLDDLDGDNEGMQDYQETPPEFEDEIDIDSEGAMDREIMMDQIRMVEVDDMDQYKKYTLPLDKTTNLKINDSDELNEVSSDDSGEIPDKEDDEEKWKKIN